MKDLVYGLVGGIVGAAVWAGVAYFTEYEIGWIAWAVGGLVGYCVALGNRDGARSPTAAGVVAVAITALSIVAGKYAAIELMIPSDEELVDLLTAGFQEEEFLISYVADGVVAEFIEADRALDWPEESNQAGPSEEADYPVDVWAEASMRWSDMSGEEQAAFRDTREAAAREEILANMDQVRSAVGRGGFLASFTPMDLIFFGLGMVTAFSVGAGRRSKEEVAAEFNSAIMLAMLRVMAADGQIDDEEVAAVASVFRELTGSTLPADAIRAEAANVASASTDLLGALRRLSPHLDPAERETVVRSAIMVAIADGSVGEEEHTLVTEIATALDVSESHLRGILAQIVEARAEMS